MENLRLPILLRHMLRTVVSIKLEVHRNGAGKPINKRSLICYAGSAIEASVRSKPLGKEPT